MHWDRKYWTIIVKGYGLIVENWPYQYVPFCDLSSGTGSLARLEMLWLMWKMGTTHFRHATAEELDGFGAAGLLDVPVRERRRSDYDVVRGRQRDPATRSKRLRMKVIKTPAVVPEEADD